jgi:hypothetical protein
MQIVMLRIDWAFAIKTDCYGSQDPNFAAIKPIDAIFIAASRAEQSDVFKVSFGAGSGHEQYTGELGKNNPSRSSTP